MTVKRINDFLFFFIVGTLYTFALSSASLAATIVEFPPWRLMLLSIAFVLLFYGVLYNRYTALVTLGLLVLTAVILFFTLYRQDFEAEWFLQVRRMADELVVFAKEKPAQQEEIYGRIIGTLVALVFALLTVINTRLYFNIVSLLVMGLGVLIIPVGMDWGKSELAVILYTFCITAFLAKRMNLMAGDGSKGAEKASAVFSLAVIPTSILILLVAWAIPKPDQLMEGMGAPGRMREAADNLIYELGPEQIKTYTTLGQTLGGPVELDNHPVMEVFADERLLLRGSARDTYTGNSWLIGDGGEDEQPLATDEEGHFLTTEYSQDILDAQMYTMWYYGWDFKAVTVQMQENRTKTIYTPPFRTSLALSGDQTPSRNQLGALSLDKPLERYASYSQIYISYSYDNPNFVYHVLEGGAGIKLGQEDALDALVEQYTQIPDELPDRIAGLAAQIAGSGGNNYEKLQALETHLQSFPYTLTPPPVPEDVDFVDHFLFEAQEGYCVYFATAMTVMARTLGIPARYVEGFSMPEERNPNGSFTVTGFQAHAWMEAYFPGFGWVPFDATPPAYLSLAEEMAEEQEVLPEPLPEEPEEEMPEESRPEDIAPPVVEEPESADEPEEVAARGVPVLVVVLSLLLVLCLSVVFLAVMRRVYRARYGNVDSMSDGEAVQAYFARILRAADACGYPIGKNETAYAYAKRVGGELVIQDTVGLDDLAEIFSRAAYSTEPVTDTDRMRMRGCYLALLRRLRRTMKRPKYYVNRYVLMRF